MWAVDNQTPFSADRTFVRAPDGAEIWLVAVRATFDIHPDGDLSISATQDPAALAPQYKGDAGTSSLRCDSDFPRTKKGTDVLLNGSAYTPNGVPARETRVSLRVGPIQKSLRVTGPRKWKRGLMWLLTPGKPELFTKAPLTYEHAFGGTLEKKGSRRQRRWSLENPVGSGMKAKKGEPAPRIEYAGKSLWGPRRGAKPAGFGAIGPAWMPRRAKAGTYDEKWQKERHPLLPLDFDEAHYYSAPEDQQVPGYLKGGEEVELLNLTPTGRLKFRLPVISLGFTTHFDDRKENHRGTLHTVLIEPDERRLIMVWHTALPCHHDIYKLQRTAIFEKERLNLSTGPTLSAAPGR